MFCVFAPSATRYGARLLAIAVLLGALGAEAADPAPFPPDPKLVNLAPLGLAQAEYCPFGTDPNLALQGRGTWCNTSRDPNVRDHELIPRAQVNKAFPSWFIIVWPVEVNFSALAFTANADEFRLAAFAGRPDANPALAPAADWLPLTVTAERMRVKTEHHRIRREIVLGETVKTRALRLQIREVVPRDHQIAWVAEFAVWGQPPAQPIVPLNDVPPVRIPVTWPTAGDAALVVNAADGQRVRNLFAQVAREGQTAEPWDLKDEDGQYVTPGVYRVKLTCGPAPALVYQMTPYPNVEARGGEGAPWVGAPRDGWLGNHGNQCSVAVVGDRLYATSGGTEGGHALVEADLQGRKLWGTPQGAEHLFTDGRTLFFKAGNHIFRFNAQTKEAKPVINLDRGPERKGAVVGMAARDNRVYVAWYSRVPCLDVATRADMVDLDVCVPKVPESVKRTDNYGIPLSPRRDFLSHFRLLGDFVAGDGRNTLSLDTAHGRGSQHHLVLAFRQPVGLGSLVFPRPETAGGVFTVAVLKPDAPYPPDPRRAADWQEVKLPPLGAWNCVALPELVRTRALRLGFVKGDLFTEEDGTALPDQPGAAPEGIAHGPDEVTDLMQGDAWRGRLEGVRLLRARFRNVMPSGHVSVSSGKYDPATGEWDAQRTAPLSPTAPGVFLVAWDQPQTIRGLAIKEIDGELTLIDALTGPGDPALTGDAGWEQIAEYRQPRRNFYQPDAGNNADALYLDGVVDFGRNVTARAVRLRVVKQWGEQGGYPAGVRRDRGGTKVEPARCRLYGLAVLEHLGGETPLDPVIFQRLAAFDGSTGQLLSAQPAALDGRLECRHQDGALFGWAGGKLMRIGDDPAQLTPFVTDLKVPGALTFDAQGRLYAFDYALDRRTIRVYDREGQFLRTIGKPGGWYAGPYDPLRLVEVVSLATAPDGSLFAVYPHDNPRRIAHLRQDGTFVQDFLGNPNYGGGGVLDPYDKQRLYFADLRFELDWEKGQSRLHSIMSERYWEASVWGPGFRHSMEPLVVKGRRYLVSAPLCLSAEMPMAVVSVYDEQGARQRLAAAIGSAGAFPHLQTPEFLAATGGKPLGGFSFIWADRDGDEQPQPAEVTFAPLPPNVNAVRVGRADADLGFWVNGTGAQRYEVREFLADGTPVYEAKPMPFWAHYHLPDGNHFRFAERGGERGYGVNEMLDPQGRVLWFYRAHYTMDGLNVPPWQPGRVDLQFGIAGMGRVNGDLGDIHVIAANNGQMNLWTNDGLLAGHVTFHLGDPRAHGFPAEHAPGTRLDGLTWGQEHFRYWFGQTADGKFYVIGGHLNVSLIEVQGLERIRRGEFDFTVTPQLLEQTRAWEATHRRREVFARAPLQFCPPGKPTLDGALGEHEWPVLTKMGDFATFGLLHDQERLYLCWSVQDRGALANGGDDFHRYFKTGAAVDFNLGTRPDADGRRQTPAAGDLRLLITQVRDKAVAVLYRPVAPGAPPDQRWETHTPAGGTTAFEQVVTLTAARVAIRGDEKRYVVEAGIPLADLGLEVKRNAVHKMDWGVIVSDNGYQTRTRQYWANAFATGVADEPTEARLDPSLWGHLRFVSGGATGPGADLTPSLTTPDGDQGGMDDLDE